MLATTPSAALVEPRSKEPESDNDGPRSQLELS